MFNTAERQTTNPKPRISNVLACSNPNGLKKKKISVANKQTFNIERVSEINPRVYGKGAVIFSIIDKISSVLKS